MVAQGSADGYLFENTPEAGNLRATDIAGAYRIVLEAGGGLGDARGHPLDEFPLRLDRRTSVFAWGDDGFQKTAKEWYL